MRMSADTLYGLLPAIYRIRDAEQGYPLRAFIGVLAHEAAVVEESIEQLYDDQFIETCADWVAPYIGGLIGYRPLHGVTAAIASPRAEIANTIAYRQRLGTASVLEQLARDVTGWPARAVEYFLLTATTQRMNHIRPTHHFAPDLRKGLALETLGGGFDPVTRLADMRSIARGTGLHNFPNVGLHLWRVIAFAREGAPATRLDDRRWLASPLGAPMPMFIHPRAEEKITHIAEPLDVAQPITRRMLHADLNGVNGAAPVRGIYGRDAQGALQSLAVSLNGTELDATEVEACDLSDVAGGWANMPAAGQPVAIDPVLGRVALPPDRDGPVTLSFHYGFPASIGGGPYERAASFLPTDGAHPIIRVPIDQPTVQDALDQLPATGGIVEIVDNGLYAADVTIAAGPEAAIELRGANGMNPHLALTNPLTVSAAFAAGGLRQARVVLDGLLISGAPVVVPDDASNGLDRLVLRHCTLVPGRALDGKGVPVDPGATSIEIARGGVTLEISGCITGRIGTATDTRADIADTIIDSAAADPTLSPEGVAFADIAGTGFGGTLKLVASTLLGKLATERVELISNSIVAARLVPGDIWPAPVRAERRQQGCVRFSYVPPGSIVPRRYRCQPQLAADTVIAAREQASGVKLSAAERDAVLQRVARRLVPGFSSRRYGRPNYAQLRTGGPVEIRTGASDESEMGAYHMLYGAQREANLRIRIDEYLRFALAAGVFFEN